MICGLDVRQELQNVLEVDDLAIVLNSKHRPRCIIEFISQSLQMLKLEESRRNALVIPFLGYLRVSKSDPKVFLFFFLVLLFHSKKLDNGYTVV